MENICKNCKYFKTLRLMYREPYIRQVRAGIEYGIQISKTKTIESNCCIKFIDDPEAPVYETDANDKCESFIPKENSNNG